MILASSEGPQDVELTVQTKVNHLSAEGIVPLALILNELVTNSIKHAFLTGDQVPKIEVSFFKTNNNHYRLEYADNGKWKEPSKHNGFGLELIDMLTEQLDGKVERSSSEEGTRFVFDLVI